MRACVASAVERWIGDGYDGICEYMSSERRRSMIIRTTRDGSGKREKKSSG